MQQYHELLEFPLVDSSYSNEEIISCIATLLSGQLTMGKQVSAFEASFSQYIGSSHSVMVNSGSSANLLAFAAITNPLRRNHLKPGDKVAVPAVCWPTSIWPVTQAGLIPVLVDVDPETLNLSIDSLKLAMSKHTIKAIMMVHVLGNSTNLDSLLEIVEDNKLLLIEDTCESLGSRYKEKCLGTLGDIGTFSFYFSHHMTTIEGGMVIMKDSEDCDLIKCLRAHGWSRDHSQREKFEVENSHIDPRFLFINVGYNLRPMEIQAAFGLQQLRRLDVMNGNRKANVAKIRVAFQGHEKWNDQLIFPVTNIGMDPCWFGFPFLVNEAVTLNNKRFIKRLLERGIDTRPIISGNMALQPAVRHFNVDLSMGPFVGAQRIHERGFFIGCHARPLGQQRIERLATSVLEALADSA